MKSWQAATNVVAKARAMLAGHAGNAPSGKGVMRRDRREIGESRKRAASRASMGRSARSSALSGRRVP